MKRLRTKTWKKTAPLDRYGLKRVEVGRPSTAQDAVEVTMDPLITDGSGPVCGALAQFLYITKCPNIK